MDLGAKPPRKNICWVPLSPAPHPPEFVALATVARIGAIAGQKGSRPALKAICRGIYLIYNIFK